MPQLHMPLQSGSDRDPARHAPLVPVGQVPRHPRPRARRDAGRGDHDRHHRRLPGGDRGGLRGDAARGRGVAVLLGVHVPVLAAPGHARRSTCPTSCPRPSSRSATSGCTALQERISLRGEPGPGRPDRRGARRRGRGPQGRRDAPRDRAAPPTTASCTSRCPAAAPTRRAPATWSPSTVTHARAAPPRRRLRADAAARSRSGARGRATRGSGGRTATDEHSHGGAGDSCGTGGPTGPVVLGLPTIGRPLTDPRGSVVRHVRRRASSRGSTASSDENICTPVPSPQASSCASWGSVTPGSKSADTSL